MLSEVFVEVNKDRLSKRGFTTTYTLGHNIQEVELSQYPCTNTAETIIRTQLRSESKRKSIKAKKERRKALYLDEGQAHAVWKPKHLDRKQSGGTATALIEMEKNKQDLLERQQKLLSRVQATREVLKVQREELATMEEGEGEEEVSRINARPRRFSENPRRRTLSDKGNWQTVVTREMEDTREMQRERRNRKKRSMHFHNIVSQYVAAMSKTSPHRETHPATAAAAQYTFGNRAPSSTSLKATPLQVGVMPLRQWKSLIFEDHKITDARHKHFSPNQFTFDATTAVSSSSISSSISGDSDATPTVTTEEYTTNTGDNQHDQDHVTFTLGSYQDTPLRNEA